MKIFELVSNSPIVTTEALLIPEFKKIWDDDKSKDKTQAFKYFCYIYFSTDYKSIYLGYDSEIREERLLEDFIGDLKWKPTTEVLNAINKYKELQNTPTMRFLISNRNIMESIGKYYDSVDWEAEDKAGKPKYDITKISNSVKQAGGIIDNIAKLEERVKKEQATTDIIARGGGVGGEFEFED